jgi:hypothetical protein
VIVFEVDLIEVAWDAIPAKLRKKLLQVFQVFQRKQ